MKKIDGGAGADADQRALSYQFKGCQCRAPLLRVGVPMVIADLGKQLDI